MDNRDRSHWDRLGPDDRRVARAVSNWFRAMELRRLAAERPPEDRIGLYRKQYARVQRAIEKAPELFTVGEDPTSPGWLLVRFTSPRHQINWWQKSMHVPRALIEAKGVLEHAGGKA